jgi:hypothetical protein
MRIADGLSPVTPEDKPPSWLTRFSRRATRLSLARPGRMAAAFLVVLLLGVAGASQLEMRLNYLELLPEADPAVVDLRWMLAKAGGEGYLVTGIRGGNREARLSFGQEWVSALAADPDFRYAELRYDSEFLRAHASSLLPLATLRELGAKLTEAVQREVERSLSLDLGDTVTHTASVSGELERLISAHEADIPAEYIEDAAKTELFVLAKPAFESSDLTRAERVLARLRANADRALQTPELRGLEVGFGGSMVLQRAFDGGVRGTSAACRCGPWRSPRCFSWWRRAGRWRCCSSWRPSWCRSRSRWRWPRSSSDTSRSSAGS